VGPSVHGNFRPMKSVMAKTAVQTAEIAEFPLPVAASDPIGEAIVIYTGFGRSSFPRARGNDVALRFGAEAGAELKQRILLLLEELAQPVPPSEKRSRKSATEQAMEQFRPRHPELSDEALKALAWTFSFGMR
jgi:hypothetical protein